MIAAPTVLSPRKSKAAERIVIRDPGGPYTKAFAEVFYKPFAEAMGIEAVGAATLPEPTSQIKAMVDSKSYLWDMGLLPLSSHNLLRDAGYLEPLELDDVPDVQEIASEFRTPFIVGNDVYSNVLAYRSDVYPAKAPAPTGGWKDLWDVDRIPGDRALRKHPFETMEQALMASGVPPEKIYPIDFDAAYKALDEIKPYIRIWWTSGAQTSQMLATGQVSMCPTWNGRAQAAIADGAPVKISWAQGLYSYNGWCILKGTPNADACRKFIAFAANAKRQAAYTPYLSYGPTNPNAYKYIDPKIAPTLPTAEDNLAQMRPFDAEFWGKVQDQAVERFNKWAIT